MFIAVVASVCLSFRAMDGLYSTKAEVLDLWASRSLNDTDNLDVTVLAGQRWLKVLHRPPAGRAEFLE